MCIRDRLPDAIVIDVAHTVTISVRDAIASADAKCIKLVSATIAIPGGDVVAPTLVDLTRPVADAAGVVLPDAIVVDVAHTVSICIRDAITSTDAQGVQLVAATIAIASGNVGAPTFVDLSSPVADAARVVLPDAIVIDVAHTVIISVGHAVATTHT